MAKKKFIDVITSKQFIRAAKSFIIIIIFLAAIAVFYLYIAKTLNKEYLLGEAAQVSDFTVVKSSLFEDKPFVVLSWKTSKPSLTIYEIKGSDEKIAYSDEEYKTEHSALLILNSFSNKYEIIISSKDKSDNIIIKEFDFKTASKDAGAVGQIRIE